jgi:nitroimidazol reductase NimA-like FMN-containing flavoprotein (pyridoxamine 5'-phosphate oxidase superfamily)
MSDFEINPRNRVRQVREFAQYDERAVHAVLDAGMVAHVGFVQDGQPFVIPMLHARDGGSLYLHGARKARIVRLLEAGAAVCVNVTLLDGIVAARSAFNSSFNYRSAVVFGSGRLIEQRDEQLHALKTISDHALPGRWEELRAPSERELAMTGVIAVAIESASAKIADEPPEDDEDDYATRIWAGVVPIATHLGTPKGDARVLPGVSPSPAIASLEGKRI